MESAQIIASFLSYIMVSSLLSSWLAHAQHDWGLIALALGWRLSLLFVLIPPAHVDGWFSYLGSHLCLANTRFRIFLSSSSHDSASGHKRALRAPSPFGPSDSMENLPLKQARCS